MSSNTNNYKEDALKVAKDAAITTLGAYAVAVGANAAFRTNMGLSMTGMGGVKVFVSIAVGSAMVKALELYDYIGRTRT